MPRRPVGPALTLLPSSGCAWLTGS
jgi:hypothetical protein